MNDAKAQAQIPPLIYVVDDEPMLLELASVILLPLHYQVKTFRDPETALAAYAAEPRRPDLIITDYAMHTLNGMDLIAECKRQHPGQKIILVSGTVGAEIFRDSPCKPDRFLPKPYEISELTEMVRTVLEA
ncbi:MAG TPA: response regulator [Dongiaceae bacterium]|jgi:DNA-binding NtrC family response regulator|nr:response regulator [Dongiaceae bacterium]